MAQGRLSMQELIQRRRRAGLVARSAELDLFRANFDTPPEDERHRFLFHVHGNAGVGKTFLVREFEQIARERGALTAYVDESAGSVPEALEVMCRQFAAQGRRFKSLERLLVSHRERLHEAEAAALADLDRALEQSPSYAWARTQRDEVRRRLDDSAHPPAHDPAHDSAHGPERGPAPS
ncbi:ATP-binding protein [Streptomyces hirsutus]|uniref:ATP-binding protein n=1 Tax=Streptomyces hirsutus TaxID=35620 RepID=UPI003D15F962